MLDTSFNANLFFNRVAGLRSRVEDGETDSFPRITMDGVESSGDDIVGGGLYLYSSIEYESVTKVGSSNNLKTRLYNLASGSVLQRGSVIFHAINISNHRVWEKYFKSLWGSSGYQIANEIYSLSPEIALWIVSHRLIAGVDLDRNYISFKKAPVVDVYLERECIHYFPTVPDPKVFIYTLWDGRLDNIKIGITYNIYSVWTRFTVSNLSCKGSINIFEVKDRDTAEDIVYNVSRRYSNVVGSIIFNTDLDRVLTAICRCRGQLEA